MELEKIITLANKKVRIQFTAMERSLRATGCKLPLWVIPYNDEKFDLPANAVWWEDADFFSWLYIFDERKLPSKINLARKYLCLTEKNYQFFDTDIIVLENPEHVLSGYFNFIVADGHWHNQENTYTLQSLYLLKKNTTNWQKNVFNSGQFACDQALYTIAELKEICLDKDFIDTCIYFNGFRQRHEQPGFNMLVNNTRILITNLSLPPVNMESTWAGDYEEEYKQYWKQNNCKPYFIHWAGLLIDQSRKIDELFFNFLSMQEKELWDKKLFVLNKAKTKKYGLLQPFAIKLKKIYSIIKEN